MFIQSKGRSANLHKCRHKARQGSGPAYGPISHPPHAIAQRDDKVSAPIRVHTFQHGNPILVFLSNYPNIGSNRDRGLADTAHSRTSCLSKQPCGERGPDLLHLHMSFFVYPWWLCREVCLSYHAL
ncbi:hypothetical protein CO2235_200097 [Cupriavidus oxalaticus]|uniref:Uncharacterized protein n=1 Tax=Cupriavidus oxalaticus TaxID=96344 RepID=A0A375G3M0_9BURK|nr:hypothetical protein CO2235_200097 [Cupriavidus oxalaticus]